MQSLGMEEGFDVGMEMSGAPAAFRQMLEDHASRRQHRPARHSACDTGIQWDEVIFKD